MTKQETLDKIAELKRAELKQFVKDCDKLKCKRERVEKGGLYWSLAENGEVVRVDGSCKCADFDFSIGNYFKTEAEAERYRDKLIATQKLLDMCDDVTDEQYNDNKTIKYYLAYNTVIQSAIVCGGWTTKRNNFVFLTREKAEQAIRDMSEKDLKLIFDR